MSWLCLQIDAYVGNPLFDQTLVNSDLEETYAQLKV